MRSDYELRHSLHGQQGTLWERQVDAPTRERIRAIVSEAGSAPALTALDKRAVCATGGGKLLTADMFFRFVDGEFAVVGHNQRYYQHTPEQLEDGSFISRGYRVGYGTYSTVPLPTQLADLSADFLRQLSGDLPLSLTEEPLRDWYLVPTKPDCTPLVIQSKQAGEYLINGVDFLAFNGYIAMPESPTAVLPLGLVRMNASYVALPAVNNFVLSAPASNRSTKWQAVYARQSQSLTSFKRAAAEYAGLYVFNSADVVLGVHAVSPTVVVYTMASAGAVTIDYPHTPLTLWQIVTPGHIVCTRFDLVVSKAGDTDDAKKIAYIGRTHPIVLDGILPVNGLTWDGRRLPMTGGNPYGTAPRLLFGGNYASLDLYWQVSAQHEEATGVSLLDQFALPSLPTTIDFWQLLRTFYGGQLVLAIADDHGPRINSRLWWFLFNQRPQSCNILLSMDLNAPYPVLTGSSGEPLVSETGEYIARPPGPECVEQILTVDGFTILLYGAPISITTC